MRTELAARLVLLTYNLWSLFTQLMSLNPGHHPEAIKSRRDFLLLAAQRVESGRQRTLKLAVKAEWWAADVVGHNCAAVGVPRQLSAPTRPSNHRESDEMARPTPAHPDRLKPNCGF